MTSIREMTDLRDRLQLALGSGYEVGEELGGGGMSRVFSARDLTLSRDIVVKTLPPELGGDINVERFTREIHFAASLQHPHIVPVHAAGDVDGLPYYTMPRVDGESLRHRLGRVQRFSVTEALSVVRDIGRALAYAHRRGLVHRDIKPENVLIADGMAVVTDFGIAKAVAAARQDDHHDRAAEDTPTALTATGTSMGTPNYMAPEQAAGDPTMDHRVDLYALGVVAYELLSGATPFADRPRREQLAAQLVERPRDISALRLDIPPSVSRLVMQCLEKEPDARPASADEIVRELDAVTTGAPASVGDDPTVIRKAFGWYAVAFIAATAVAWGAMTLIGLPDWVLPGTIVIMALGLPLVAVTALTRYAAFQSTTGMLRSASEGGWLFTPTESTLRVAQALTWKRIATGGGVSLGGFGILVAAFMVTRSLGIGPAASLLGARQMTRHEPIVFTDFTSAPHDSAIARVVTEAVRIAFQESDVVRVATPESVSDALLRMRRPAGERLTLPIARELAAREGIRVVVDGEVLRDGQQYLLRVRLVAADSGNVLTTEQAVASSTADIVAAADRLTRGLRRTIGESLKSVRATPPLQRATTASFEALLLYSECERAYRAEFNLRKCYELLQRALELDSGFALAWRKLYVTTGYLRPVPAGGWQPSRDDMLEQSFRYRHNASASERLAIEGQYYWIKNDRPRSIAAYEEYARRTGLPLHNHAWFLLPLRQFARSESLFRVIVSSDPTARLAYKGWIWALMNQEKHDEADSVAQLATGRFDGFRLHETWLIGCGRREFQQCQASLDSIRIARGGDLGEVPAYVLGDLALMRGQVDRWNQLAEEQRRRGTEFFAGANLTRSAWIDIWIRHQPRAATARLDSLPDNLRLTRARFYAMANELESARALLKAAVSRAPDSTLRLAPLRNRQWEKAELAAAEGRTQEAVDTYRSSDRLSDGLPESICAGCLSLDLARVFDRAQLTDSAIFYYKRFLSTPLYSPEPLEWGSRLGFVWWKYINEAWIHERLGELYQEKGLREDAVRHYTQFVELWKDADPELQPRVREARARLARLRSS